MSDTPQLLLAHHLKALKLPTFLREYDKIARQCAAEGVDHVRYLVRLSELELIDRERRMVERRIRQARFPAVKSLDAFDFKAIPSLNKTLVLELARCEYVDRRENVIALGNSGTGKTHVALGLGLSACQKGLSVGFITAAALIQASHAVYYGFGTLNWKAQGYSENVIGWLWAEGVAAEIVLFAFGARLIRRFGPVRLIALGGLAGALRWSVTGVSDDLLVLIAMQALHGFTFGATHLGAIYFIARRMPQALSASAQGLYSSVVMGLALGAASLAAGKLYALYGSGAYQAMALLAAAGGGVALMLMNRR